MSFEGKVWGDSAIFEGNNVIGVLDPDGKNLLLPLVKTSCFFQLKIKQYQTSVHFALEH